MCFPVREQSEVGIEVRDERNHALLRTALSFEVAVLAGQWDRGGGKQVGPVFRRAAAALAR